MNCNQAEQMQEVPGVQSVPVLPLSDVCSGALEHATDMFGRGDDAESRAPQSELVTDSSSSTASTTTLTTSFQRLPDNHSGSSNSKTSGRSHGLMISGRSNSSASGSRELPGSNSGSGGSGSHGSSGSNDSSPSRSGSLSPGDNSSGHSCDHVQRRDREEQLRDQVTQLEGLVADKDRLLEEQKRQLAELRSQSEPVVTCLVEIADGGSPPPAATGAADPSSGEASPSDAMSDDLMSSDLTNLGDASCEDASTLSMVGMSRSGRPLWLSSCGRAVWKAMPLATGAAPEPTASEGTAMTAPTVQHAHLVSVYNRQRVGTRLVEGRELCDGGELFDVIADEGGMLHTGRLPMALRLFAQIASAVSYAHAHDLVAGQLRPEHVLLTYDRRDAPSFRGSPAPPIVKLLGFDPRTWRALKYGSAPAAELRLARACCPLDAPELHQLEEQVSMSAGAGAASASADVLAAADVWTLGTLLVGLLAGRPPSITGRGIELKVTMPQEMSAAPPCVLKLVESMMRTNPRDRPTAAEVKAMADDLSMPPPAH